MQLAWLAYWYCFVEIEIQVNSHGTMTVRIACCEFLKNVSETKNRFNFNQTAYILIKPL
jgi:hypothetical protein